MAIGNPPDPSGPSPVRDVDALIASWEAMSEHYLEGRAELVGAAIDQLAQRIAADSATVVELGSGPIVVLTAARPVGHRDDPDQRGAR